MNKRKTITLVTACTDIIKRYYGYDFGFIKTKGIFSSVEEARKFIHSIHEELMFQEKPFEYIFIEEVPIGTTIELVSQELYQLQTSKDDSNKCKYENIPLPKELPLHPISLGE